MIPDCITSSANPRFRLARDLLRRKGRIRHGQVLLEGLRLIEDCLSAGIVPALFFYTRAAQPVAASLGERIAAQGGQSLCLSDALMDALSTTVHTQGMVAVAPQPHLPAGQQGLHVVVDGLRDPGNMGTLLRSAAAARGDAVHCLPGVVDVWSPKVLRAGMGAHFRVAIRSQQKLDELQAALAGHRWYVAEAGASTSYDEVDWTAPSVLVVGGEASGPLQRERLANAQAVAIPMARQVESLNAAIAASIILFEAVRQRRHASRS